MWKTMGKLFYLMGKSASGKDHIYHALLKESAVCSLLHPLVLYTTRPMRSGETDGREYFFVGEADLACMRAEGKVIEERCYQTVFGPWYYFTADNGNLNLEEQNYLGIGTLESYHGIVKYFGQERVVPLYIETDDGIRLERALKRERSQEQPKYAELCRRFLADCEDFSEEKISAAGITRRFANDTDLPQCIDEVAEYIESMVK